MHTNRANQITALPVQIRRNVDLTGLNSLQVQCEADQFAELSDLNQLDSVLDWLQENPAVILGGATNVLLTQNRLEHVLLVSLQGKRVISESGDSVQIELAAGENWHEAVQWTLAQQCFGLENLSLIPGRVGAAPVQNIGAYGVELAEFVHTVHAVRLSDQSHHELSASECQFGYRDSLFKQQPGQWLITGVTLTLSRKPTLRLDYGEIRQSLAAKNLTHPTPQQVSRTVCEIRQRKLPDPAVLPNAGSFFKNPVVPATIASALLNAHPTMPHFTGPEPDTVKLAAGWLIESAGLKGVREQDAGTHAQHALVLVNYGQASGADLRDFALRIQRAVQAKFSIWLEPEPVFIPSA